MDLYRPWKVLALPLIPIMGGFALIKYFGQEWYVSLTASYIQVFGLIYGTGLVYQSYLIQGWMTAINTPDPKPAPTVAESTMPEVKTYKPLVQFENVVEFPTFNTERRFWIDVLRMYDFDPATQKHVDLTEERWVINKRMFSQKPFANMKLKAEHFGLLKRKHKGKSAGLIVKSREAVAMVAAGQELPYWTPPPPSR